HSYRCGSDWSQHRQVDRADPREPATPRAGLSGLHRHPPSGPPIRCRTAGSSLRPRSRYRRPVLRINPVPTEELGGRRQLVFIADGAEVATKKSRLTKTGLFGRFDFTSKVSKVRTPRLKVGPVVRLVYLTSPMTCPVTCV